MDLSRVNKNLKNSDLGPIMIAVVTVMLLAVAAIPTYLDNRAAHRQAQK